MMRFVLLLGRPIGAANFMSSRAAQALVALPTSKGERAVGEGSLEGAAGLYRVAAITKTALAGQGNDISKSSFNACLRLPWLDFTHTRGIDHDYAVGGDEQFALGRGVAPLAIDIPHRLGVL